MAWQERHEYTRCTGAWNGKVHLAGPIQRPALERRSLPPAVTLAHHPLNNYDTPTHNYILCPQCFLEDASDAYNNAVMQGQNLANTIANYRYKYVHLLGHSAGANLIDVAAKELVRIYIQRNENPFIHLTFFDAFTLSDFDKDSYGFLPNNYQSYYSEHYVHRGLAFMDTSTDECLSNAFNFNITDWAHSSEEGGFAGHSWPHNWYERSVTFTSNTNTPPPGFNLSFEGGNDQFDKIDELYRPGEQCPLMDEGTRCQPAACWE
jgi:hypothetical protein